MKPSRGNTCWICTIQRSSVICLADEFTYVMLPHVSLFVFLSPYPCCYTCLCLSLLTTPPLLSIVGGLRFQTACAGVQSLGMATMRRTGQTTSSSMHATLRFSRCWTWSHLRSALESLRVCGVVANVVVCACAYVNVCLPCIPLSHSEER